MITSSCPSPIVHPRRRARRRLAVAFASLVTLATLGACGVDPGRAVSSQTGATPDFVEGLVEVMLSPPNADAQRRYLDRMPPPDGVHEQTVANRHDPRVADRIESLTYPGVTVDVYHANASGRRIPMSVRVTERSEPIDGLFVGMSTSALIAVAGAPDDRGADAWRFRVFDDPRSAPYEIIATVESGTVAALTWRAYLD
ncbi:MAG: hypothetical protein R6W77_12125 [Trueperaceae bacterium]